VPHLQFVLDEGVRNAQEVARLLAEEKPHNEPEAEASEADQKTED
jgi:hypothetical protein